MNYLKNSGLVLMSLIVFSIFACSSIREVTSELKGTSKPEGAIAEAIPATKKYNVPHEKLWKLACMVLDEQGYMYESNKSTNMIKTEPKQLGDTSKFRFIGSDYTSKLYIKIEGSSVTFKARFGKKSNLVQGGEDLEYPEKENQLRKTFFEALDRKIAG